MAPPALATLTLFVDDPRVFALAAEATVAEAIAAVRAGSGATPEYVFVVERPATFIGQVATAELLRLDPASRLAEVVIRPAAAIHARAGPRAIVAHPGWQARPRAPRRRRGRSPHRLRVVSGAPAAPASACRWRRFRLGGGDARRALLARTRGGPRRGRGAEERFGVAGRGVTGADRTVLAGALRTELFRRYPNEAAAILDDADPGEAATCVGAEEPALALETMMAMEPSSAAHVVEELGDDALREFARALSPAGRPACSAGSTGPPGNRASTSWTAHSRRRCGRSCAIRRPKPVR